MSEHGPVIGSPVEQCVRSAARRLAAEHGPGMEAEVEAVLLARGTQQRPAQYIDPISLGSLIVSVATLAWTVYQDLRKKTRTPARDVVERRVRVELPPTNQASTAEHDRIIEVVVDEVIKNADQ